MSRWLVASMSAAVLVACAPGLRAADDDPKEIVAKAIKAHGGEEYLTKHQAVQASEKGKINIPGAGEADFTSEFCYMLPGKFKHTYDFEIMNQKVRLVALIDGDKASVEGTAGGQKIDLGENIVTAYKDIPHILRVGHLTPLVKEKGYELSIIGEDKVEGKKVVGVRVTKKDQKDVSLFFDKETFLLVKMEYQTVDSMNGKEITEERIIKEYMKNKDGIQVPKKVLVKQDGKTFLESETVEAKYLEKIDDSEFKK
jgi:hypothetical protein